MPCVTFYSDHEVAYHRKNLKDLELEYWLKLAADATGREMFIRKYEHLLVRKWWQRWWFRKPKTVYLYQLLVNCCGEWQIINFPGGKSSINHDVERFQMMTCLMGICIGAHNQTP